MKKKAIIFAAVFFAVLCGGCGGKAMSSKTILVSLPSNQEKYQIKTYAIFPFSDSRSSDEQHPNNAVQIMTDSFETAFLKTGSKLVERNLIENILKEMKFSYSGNVDDKQLKEFGKMTNADAIILGSVRIFHPARYENRNEPDSATSCTEISFSVKAIHIQSGEILWKGTITKSPDVIHEMLLPCKYDVTKYADRVASDIVNTLFPDYKP